MKKLTLMIAVLLAGCGGSGEVVISSPGPGPNPLEDAFVARVKKVVASMPEDTEAAAIDKLAGATSPDDSESIAL
ncbi:MAG: hypothetical protein M3R60_14585 [Pseudomonadota bacterium]|nr:hypothetical protein [Pseudomonadota bacterium]